MVRVFTLGLEASLLTLGCFSAIMASYSSRVISCKLMKLSRLHQLQSLVCPLVVTAFDMNWMQNLSFEVFCY